MNFVDVLLIIGGILLSIAFIVLVKVCGFDEKDGECTMFIVIAYSVLLFIILNFFFVMDRQSGSTQGEITSVDKNFFQTTALYIKTTENKEEKYCIENDEIAEKATDLIGKKVKIKYGTRVGFYSTGACHQSPVDDIIELEN